MGLRGIFEVNKLQKGMPEYDRYAKKSMVFGVIILCLILLIFWLSGYLIEYSVHSNNEIMGDTVFFVTFIVAPITLVVLAIIGVIFGIKGLKSRKVSMSVAGFIVSSIVLILSLTIAIYFIAGGEFM